MKSYSGFSEWLFCHGDEEKDRPAKQGCSCKKEPEQKPFFGFYSGSFFVATIECTLCEHSIVMNYSRRSAAVCPFPTADHPPAPECFFRSRWMILIISAPLPFPIPVKSLFQFPLCHNDRSNDNDALQCTHNSPNIPYAVAVSYTHLTLPTICSV